MSLLAVDLGSSSCKAVVFSEDGCALAQNICSYPSFHTPQPSWAELPAESFWNAFTSVTRAVSAGASNDPVEVLSISSHGETFVAVDSQQQTIAPAILNMDNRAVAEAKFIAERLGPSHLFEITGLTAHPMYPVAKMIWLRQHEPDLFAATARFLAIPTFILTRLGLPPYVDYSLASRFSAFDIHKRCWSSEILDTFGFSTDQLPLAVPAGTVAGELSTTAASTLGLSPGTLVAVGGHDQPCAALGSGVLDSGRVSASLGTYECLVAASRKPALSDRALAANLNSYCHVVPERYVTLAYFPGGIMLDWFLRILASSNDFNSDSVGELCRELEDDVSPGPSGLCITPHLMGTCNPDFDPHATGVIAGVRPGTSRADLYKGIVEGIACEFTNMCDLLEKTAGTFSEIFVSGGGARSPLGLNLRAAFSGRELNCMECSEVVCLGTAMLGGLALGKYGSFSEAAERLVRVSQTVTPDRTLAESYTAQTKRYRLLYSSLAAIRRSQAEFN